jgi:hypothetical protein
MLRRAVLISGAAVVLSAAAALAFAPRNSRVGGAWTGFVSWSGRAFTPAPAVRGALGVPDDIVLENGAGTPGTFCPTTKDRLEGSTRVQSHAPAVTPLDSTGLMLQGKSEIPQSLAPAICNVPAAVTPVPRVP